MRILSASTAPAGDPMDPAHFSGPASSLSVHRGTEPQPVHVSLVRFGAGARNHWHSHTGGQVLHVVEGEGWVQSRDGGRRPLRTGDTVAAAPGEQHWHGATDQGTMAHLAVTIGETSWLEPS